MKYLRLMLLIFSLMFLCSCSNENIELSDYNLSLKIGEEIEVLYDGTKQIIWESEDINIAIVEDGKVTAVGDGKTNILVYLKDDKNTCVTIEVLVTSNLYKINYNLDGGECDELVNTFKDNEEIVLPSPTKEGYTFIGWYEETSLGFDKVDKLSNRDYYLIAKWKKVINKYNITFYFGLDYDSNDIYTEIIQVNENECAFAPDEIEFKYYNLAGWYTEKEFINEYDFNNEITQDIILFAKYEKVINKYNITFNFGLDYDSNDIYTEIIQVNENECAFAPDEIEIKYYDLAGWYTEKEFINEYDFNNEITQDIILFAKYERNQFVITFDADDGIMDSYFLEFDLNEEIVLPVPRKDGFEFLGWFDNDNKIEKITNKDYNLKAKWCTKIYSIRYSLNGGTCENLLEEFVYSDDVVLPTPTRPGFTFLGWFESYDLEAVTGDNLEPKNYTLTAKWEKEIYRVTYDLDGGIAEGLVTEFSYPNRPKLLASTKSGFVFSGWYSDNEYYDVGDVLEYKNYNLKACYEKEYIPYELLGSIYPFPTKVYSPESQTNFSYGFLKKKNSLDDNINMTIGVGNFDELHYKNMKILIKITNEFDVVNLKTYDIALSVNDFDNFNKYGREKIIKLQNEQQKHNPYLYKTDYKLIKEKFKFEKGSIFIVMVMSETDEVLNNLDDYEEYRIKKISFKINREENSVLLNEAIYLY